MYYEAFIVFFYKKFVILEMLLLDDNFSIFFGLFPLVICYSIQSRSGVVEKGRRYPLIGCHGGVEG